MSFVMEPKVGNVGLPFDDKHWQTMSKTRDRLQEVVVSVTSVGNLMPNAPCLRRGGLPWTFSTIIPFLVIIIVYKEQCERDFVSGHLAQQQRKNHGRRNLQVCAWH